MGRSSHIPRAALGKDSNFQTMPKKQCSAVRLWQPWQTSPLLLTTSWILEMLAEHVNVGSYRSPRSTLKWRLSWIVLERPANSARRPDSARKTNASEATLVLVLFIINKWILSCMCAIMYACLCIIRTRLSDVTLIKMDGTRLWPTPSLSCRVLQNSWWQRAPWTKVFSSRWH